MKLLALLFLSMFLYGAVSGSLGAGLLALIMTVFVLYAQGHFAKQDAAWAAMPVRAKQQQDTQLALSDHECECTRDRL